MKKPYLMILFLVASVLASAKGIDVTEARLVAQNFYKHTTGQTVSMSLSYQCNNTDATDGAAVGEPLYYTFDVPGNGGFVMVSADDLVKPIIGYNTTGRFRIQNAPPEISDWYAKYAKQIAYAKTTLTATTQDISSQWGYYTGDPNKITKQLRAGGAVGPLLTTTWDQDLYYNALCPSDASSPQGFGGNVPTGCGATAMSQIMRYWSYPAQGTGQNSYNSNYGTLSANFGATTYNWANMPNSVTVANNDVATIMYQCGVAVDMDYTYNESLSYILAGTGGASSCQQAYTSYFGYDAATLQGLLRSDYPVESDWTTLINTELSAGRPIQYAGSGPDGGHTFVLDGTDGAGYYHINWGWSGADNGYYTVDALDPSPYANGTFDNGEQMIIGIQPPNITVVSSGIDLYAAITVSPNPIEFLNTFTVTTNVVNDGNTSFSGQYCCAFFDASGNFIRYVGDILNTGSSPLPAGDYYNSGLTFTDTSTAVTVPGTYTIGIYYQATGANTWTLAGQSTYTNPISVTVTGPADNIALYSDMVPSPTTFVQGQPASVNVNLINNGSATYTGTYEAVLLDLQGNYVEQIGTYTESTGLPAGDVYSSPYITFSSAGINSPEGEYILAIAENPTGSASYYYCGGQTYANPILINVVNPDINVLAVKNIPTDPLRVYPNPTSNTINIDAGDARGTYTVRIYNTLGQLMSQSSGNLNGQKLSEDVSGFATGLYTIDLEAESGVFMSRFAVRQ